MGVTRSFDDVFFFGYIDDELDLSLDEEDEEVQHALESKKKTNKKKAKVTNHSRRRCHSDSNIGRSRKMSSRQQRNYERLQQLMDQIEMDESPDSIWDTYEPTMSVFSELFATSEKMKIWNDFINKSEEEQMELINRDRRANSETKSSASETLTVDDSWEVVDNRATHPAFPADVCFKRINSNLRSVLRRRNLPMDRLELLEQELTNFFCEWPKSVYISQLLNRFERMLIHALCQYLDLNSRKLNQSSAKLSQSPGKHNQSPDDPEDKQHTEVCNKHSYFSPPSMRLVDYISKSH